MKDELIISLLLLGGMAISIIASLACLNYSDVSGKYQKKRKATKTSEKTPIIYPMTWTYCDEAGDYVVQGTSLQT